MNRINKSLSQNGLTLSLFFLLTCSCSGGGPASVADDVSAILNDSSSSNVSLAGAFSPGLLFPNGIEPGNPQECEAPSGNRCWYVDAEAPPGGNGTFDRPYRSFETIVGYTEGGSYRAGLIQGGDYLYVRGTFRASNHDPISANQTILMARPEQGGTPERPTVIKSWRNTPRAVFDGENQLMDMIYVRGHGAPFGSIRIQNIEMTRANGRGIHIGELVEHAQVVSVVVHDGVGDGIIGTGGGLLFRAYESKHDFLVQNSLFYSNHRNRTGGDNNIGGISILAGENALDGSKVVITNNIIRDEVRAIRHKHSGNVHTLVFHNIISDSRTGVYLRSFDNEIHHNLLLNLGEAFMQTAENQRSDAFTQIYNNTIVDCQTLFAVDSETSDFRRQVLLTDNIFQTSRPGEAIISLGRWRPGIYFVEDWQSGHNAFFYNQAAATFLFHDGRAMSYENGLEYLSDQSSIFAEARFVNPADLDFRIIRDSADELAGSNGQVIGAFPPATE